MPVRRKPRIKYKDILKRGLFKNTLLILLCSIIFILFRIYTSGGEWNENNKLNIVINGEEQITVVVFDPKKKEMVSVLIPGDTEVEVARNLGRWKLGSVWQLGVNEGVGGKLLAETVTRYFNLPTYVYMDKEGMGVLENSLLSTIKVLLYPTDSNLSKKDVFNIVRFSKGVKNPDKRVVKLNETIYLKPEELKGGGLGYKKVKDLPQWIIAPFTNEEVVDELTTVKIINHSEDRFVSSDLGRVMEATGAKVAQVVNKDKEEGDCTIETENEELGSYYSKLFDCEYGKGIENSFDIIVTIKEDFIKRY